MSTTNVSQFAQPKKHHGLQYVSTTKCPRLPGPLWFLITLLNHWWAHPCPIQSSRYNLRMASLDSYHSYDPVMKHGVRVIQVVAQYYGDLHIISKTAVLPQQYDPYELYRSYWLWTIVYESYSWWTAYIKIVVTLVIILYSLRNAWLVNHYFTTCMSHGRCTDHGLVYIYPKYLWWYTVHQPYNSNHCSKTHTSHTSHSKMKMPLYRSYQFVYIGQPSWLVHSYPERVVWVQALAGVTVLCSWARHLTLTVPLSTQEYKWVPVNC